MKNRAIRYHQFGRPEEVLRLEEVDFPRPGEGEVLIRMLASAVHPSDFGLIQGSYGLLRELPATGGREGVGKVVEAGRGVDTKIEGKLVAMPEASGTWREFALSSAEELLLLPSLVPADQLAVAVLNPLTAWRLLHDFEYLREGDCIIQNAGNSAVGQSVVQFCKRLGIRCVSLVRSKDTLQRLKQWGAEEVWLDDEEVVERARDFTEGKNFAMALNSVGGRSALRLAKTLRSSGVHLTFGAMDGAQIRFPTRELIFDDLRFVGFWLDRWKRRQSPAGLRNAVEQVLQPLALKEVRHSIDRVFSMEDFAEAISRNRESRMGKVLLSPDPDGIGPS